MAKYVNLQFKFKLNSKLNSYLKESPSTLLPVSLSVDCRGTNSPAKTP